MLAQKGEASRQVGGAAYIIEMDSLNLDRPALQ